MAIEGAGAGKEVLALKEERDDFRQLQKTDDGLEQALTEEQPYAWSSLCLRSKRKDECGQQEAESLWKGVTNSKQRTGEVLEVCDYDDLSGVRHFAPYEQSL